MEMSYIVDNNIANFMILNLKVTAFVADRKDIL